MSIESDTLVAHKHVPGSAYNVADPVTKLVHMIGGGFFNEPKYYDSNRTAEGFFAELFTTGWALLFLALSYWLIDACDSARVRSLAARIARPLEMYGVNALFIFAFSGLVAKMLGYFKVQSDADTLISVKAWLFAQLSQLPLSSLNASLLFAVLFNLSMLAVAALLWRRKIFIKV